MSCASPQRIDAGYALEEDGSLTLGTDGRLRISAIDLLRYLAASEANSGIDPEQEEQFEGDYETTEDEDEGDDPDHYYVPSSKPHFKPVKKPVTEGLALLMSGEFGRLGHQYGSRLRDDPKFANHESDESDGESSTGPAHKYSHNFTKTLLNRSNRLRPIPKEDIASEMIPNSNGTAVAKYSSNAYVGQYSSGMLSVKSHRAVGFIPSQQILRSITHAYEVGWNN